MSTVVDFLAMGGYGAFIWSAYGIAALVLVVMLIMSLRQLRAAGKQVAALEAASPRRRPAPTGGENQR